MDILPALRYVDATPIEHEGQQYICISDPAGYVEGQLLLSPAAFLLAACLDGRRDATGVCRAFRKLHPDVSVGEEQLRTIVQYLDRHGFLWSEAFAALQARVVATYRSGSCRAAHFAGKAYPAEPAALRSYIDAFFEGAPPRARLEGTPLRGMIVPHIDFARGARAYGEGYARLMSRGRPGTVLVFGVAHAGTETPFVLTRKNFETPLGMLPVDQDAVDALEAACDWDPYADEMVHRTEHSIEFQAVMLAYAYGSDVRIVPILCGGGGEADGAAASLGTGRFLDTCRGLAAEPSRRATVIAGADLAHVGRCFGDDFDVDERVLDMVRRRDLEDLERAAQREPEAFLASVMRDHNERKVCGLHCIYAALQSLNGGVSSGRLLHHDHAADPAGGIVSFASMIFE